MKIIWQVSNILSLVFALVLNTLVGAQLLDLPAIQDISDTYATFLTPAGYAFSIWSLIYALLILFIIYQARDILRPVKDNRLPYIVGPFFIIASICNGLWTYVFVQEMIGLSVVILLALCASLYILLWRLKIALKQPSFRVVLCVWWPLMIYTGWVTVATVVNVASWLDSLSITISAMAAVAVLIVLGIGLVVLLMKWHVRELLLACAWGIGAIGVQQMQRTEGSAEVMYTALAVAAGLVLACTVHAYIHRHENLIAVVKHKIGHRR